MAGARVEKRLNAAKVRSLDQPGKYEDGGGLRLVIDQRGVKRWVMRVSVAGRRVERGLGGFPATTLEQARQQAQQFRTAAKDGIDLREQEKRDAAVGTTFEQAFWLMFEHRGKQLTNDHYRDAWPASMRNHVFPTIGHLPIAEMRTPHIIEVLSPVWFEKPDLGKRLLQRIETVFKSAVVRGLRERASPCIGVAAELGVRHREQKHYPAMPWREVPAFLAWLREPSPWRFPATALCLEFLVMTAARSDEARGALWSEIDLGAATWSIPKERMKARRPHRVPLAPRCIEILRTARELNRRSVLVFEGTHAGRPLSDMTMTKALRDAQLPFNVHGFRSSFRIWSAEEAKTPFEVGEAALSHKLKDRVAAAYLRTDFFEERRSLMAAWAAHCCGK